MENLKFYSPREERANALTHLLGVIIMCGALVYFLPTIAWTVNPWVYFSYALMFLGAGSSYVASYLYHAATDVVRKQRLRRFDHAAIYLSIAGNYTPFTLYLLRDEGAWGWALFGTVWLAALVGIALNFRKMKRTDHIKTASYIAMGWVIVIAVKPLYDVLLVQDRVYALYWLFAEGLFYSVGAVIYARAKREFIHTVWHVFVLLGTLSHLVAAYLIL